MFTLRQWWERKGLQFGLLLLVVGGAWMLREAQGGPLMEAYQTITRPLHLGQTQMEREENAKVLEMQAQKEELETQNKKLKELLGYVEQQGQVKSTPARVIGRGADHWWQQVILDRGSNSGIKKDDIVTAPGGLVGRVDEVTANTSRVSLISDLNSQIGVTISRSNFKGLLRGKSASDAVLEFYEKVPNVKVGDLVTTSNYSQKFPPGLAVGRVVSIDTKKLPAPEAVVELLPPMRSLDWVVVSPKPENTQPQENSQPAKQQLNQSTPKPLAPKPAPQKPN
jgi:rod shape-determining protein MreC